MSALSSAFMYFVFFGIIYGDVTSAQSRQHLLSNTRLPERPSERLLRETFRSPAAGSQFRSGVSLLPGARHSWFESPRASSQRLSTGRRRNLGSRQTSLLSNRLHSTGLRPGFESLSRQARPSRLRTLRDRTVTDSPAQLRIYARNLKIIDGKRAERRRNRNARTNPVKNRSAIATRERLPRVRTRFRQQAHPVKGNERRGKERRGKKRRGKESNNQNKSERVDKTNGVGKDLIAIDDVISLVKEIKSNKKPSPDKSQIGAVNVSKTSGSDSSKGVSSSILQVKEPPTAGRSTGNNSTRRHESSPLDLLAQMALMNTDGGMMLDSLLSNPAFLSQLSADNNGILNPKPAEKIKGRSKSESKKRKTEVMIHPSLLKDRGKKSDRKLIKTGNPVQDEMISTLLQQTIKNIREDIQEGII